MNICIVSLTSICGSSFYLSKLVNELRKKSNIFILGEKIINCYINAKIIQCWSRNNIYPNNIIKWIMNLNCNIILIQYEYSMFGSPLKTAIILPFLLLNLKIYGIKIALTLHGVFTPLNIPRDLKKFRMLLPLYYRLLGKLTNLIIVLNKSQKKYLISYGLNEDKIRLIPHGTDYCQLMNHNPHNDFYTVFFHGFIRPSKGLDILIKAINILKDNGIKIRLRILGSVPFQWEKNRNEIIYFNEIKRIIYERGLHDYVDLKVGFHTDEEIKDHALKSDIIVLPYTDRYLESSGVVHSLMGCGTPIIASRTPRFMADLENMKDSILVNPTPIEIADAIKLLLDDRGLWERISRNLIRKAQGRTWEIVSDMYLKAFEEALGR